MEDVSCTFVGEIWTFDGQQELVQQDSWFCNIIDME